MARANKRVRIGDTVKVISGNHKGETGKVLTIDSKRGRVTVEAVNRVKRHRKGETRGAGEIVEMEASIHLSNVVVLDGDGNGTRIGVRTDDDGRRYRFAKRSGERL